MARTMTDEQEREIREADEAWFTDLKMLFAELDAERDAHNETKVALSAEQSANAHMRSVVDSDSDELAALKERLKLAEAVCAEMGKGTPTGNVGKALAAWRAGK